MFSEENVSRVYLCKTKLIFTFNDPTEAFKYMIRSCVEMPFTINFNLSKNCSTLSLYIAWVFLQY